jgi:prepilin-type N-terminal cleavage/methylation domain-containing protein
MRHPPVLSPALPLTLSRSHGFTLIELMVTLSVLVVVMSVAVPSMSEFSASNQVAAAKSSFAGAVALARTEAARRGKTVILQPMSAGPDGNEYLNGWEIVADDDGDGLAGASEPRLRRAATSYEKIKLSGARSLAFRASGALLGSSAQVYTVCRASGSSAGYSITVTPSGVADVATITTCS